MSEEQQKVYHQKTIEIIMNRGDGMFTGSSARQHLLMHLKQYYDGVSLGADGIIKCSRLKDAYKYGSKYYDNNTILFVKAEGDVHPATLREFLEQIMFEAKGERYCFTFVATKNMSADGLNFCERNRLIPVIWNGKRYEIHHFDIRNKEEIDQEIEND